ncbi:MAG: hypothetical protein JO256_06375 [Alphaproteobacteria bacterium]|nr:hypothetical protein [Alphaproteobacteria bacterium]
MRQRLASGAAALLLQGGIAALLLMSFQAVRHFSAEKETILTLPPLTKPAPVRAPVVIDARGKAPRAAAPPSAAPLPPYALPSFNLGPSLSQSAPLGGIGVQGRGRGAGGCRPALRGTPGADADADCPPLPALAKRDPNLVPLDPGKPVKNEAVWQAEVARRNAPPVIPGGNPLGALFTLLTHPGAFLDKRNYSYAAPGNGDEDKFDGAEMTHRAWSQIPQCAPALDDTTRRNCAFNVAATYKVRSGEVYPDHAHVSDFAFREALAATQDRMRSLYGRPVLTLGGKTGDGDDKNSTTGGADAAAGGGNSAGTGR